jgi:hypothetical protein
LFVCTANTTLTYADASYFTELSSISQAKKILAKTSSYIVYEDNLGVHVRGYANLSTKCSNRDFTCYIAEVDVRQYIDVSKIKFCQGSVSYDAVSSTLSNWEDAVKNSIREQSIDESYSTNTTLGIINISSRYSGVRYFTMSFLY